MIALLSEMGEACRATLHCYRGNFWRCEVQDCDFNLICKGQGRTPEEAVRACYDVWLTKQRRAA